MKKKLETLTENAMEEDLLVDLTFHDVPAWLLMEFAEKIVHLFPLDHFTVTEDFSSILEEFSEAFS